MRLQGPGDGPGGQEQTLRPVREYQTAAHDAVWHQFDQGARSTLVVMPTGTGKTWVAANVAATAKSRGLKTLFLAHREILVRQAHDTLTEANLEVATEMADQDAQAQIALFGHADVVVATVQTLQGDRLRRWSPDHFGLIITDESHRAAAPSHQNVYHHFNGYPHHLGITATPDGASGNIGNVFHTLAFHYPMRQAVLDGYLVNPVHERCKVPIDLRAIRTTGGDFNAGDIAQRIMPSVEYLADGIKQRIGDRQTVVFTPDVGSALGIAQALMAPSSSGAGLKAAFVAGDSGRFGMSRTERDTVLGRLRDGTLQVVICCELLFEGWDCPTVAAVVIARPTRLRYRFCQMSGRGTRLCPQIGKTDCLIVDFDWKTDESSRDLMTTVELFADDDVEIKQLDGLTRQKVIAEAKSLLEKGQKDPIAALEEAKDRLKRRDSLPMYLRGLKAEFDVEVLDPLGVSKLLGVTLKPRNDLAESGREPARAYQCRELRDFGVLHPEKFSFWGASRMLRTLHQRKEKGLATLQQIRRMTESGITGLAANTMTAAQASAVIKAQEEGLTDRIADQ